MKIARYFSTEGLPVVQQVKWKTIPEVRVEDGLTKEVIFSAKNVEVPEHWSDNAAGILANKYFRKAGVPTDTFEAGFASRSWSWGYAKLVVSSYANASI
jgi:ribonucleoside-diphosphate reductase alpha chain